MNQVFRVFGSLALISCVCISTAHAQATRTWVSGVGDDVNPCSRTAPCKTFAGAISKTANGGEIDILDPGGYGAVTITKSITLSGDGSLGSILAVGGQNGITIDDSATVTPGTIQVILRKLSLNGGGLTTSGPGAVGVKVNRASAVILDGVTIDGFQQGVTSTIGNVVILNSVITNNPMFGIHALVGASTIAVERSSFNGNGTAVQGETGTTIRLSDSSFINNGLAFGCGAGVTGVLVSTNDNRKANNTGGGGTVCAPTLSTIIQ